MKHLRIAAVLLVMLTVVGCDMAKELSSMNEQMTAITKEIKQELGLEAHVGWNIHNGVLTQVTVSIPAADVMDSTVREITHKISPIVLGHFDSKPKLFQLTLVVEQ